MDYHYETHLHALAIALMQTGTGDVLELGSGDCSTVFLHNACRVQRRYLMTMETNEEWLAKIAALAWENHDLRLIDRSWEGFDWSRKWSVVLVDHAPGEHRHIAIDNLKDNVGVMVVHDTENAPAADYRYEKVFPKFKYVYDWKLLRPWTTLLSNSIDVREWFE